MTLAQFADNVVYTLRGLGLVACVVAIYYGIGDQWEYVYLGILGILIIGFGMGTDRDIG